MLLPRTPSQVSPRPSEEVPIASPRMTPRRPANKRLQQRCRMLGRSSRRRRDGEPRSR